LGDDEETAAINTATPTTLEVSGNGASVNSGGAIVFSANRGSWKFAAIKSLVQSGTANTLGDLAFSTRNATGDSTLTERMRITYGGNVGVGLSAPTDKLHVGGALRVDSWIGGNSSTGKLTLYGDREATQGVTILDSGNVGIGTSAPAKMLHIESTEGNQLRLAYNSSYYWDIERDAVTGALTFTDSSNGEIMRIDDAGTVGIGTSSPAAPLHVFKGSVSGPTELARFQGGSGAENYRNFISLYTTNPSYWWETSVQDPSGGGTQNNLVFVENSGGTRTERMTLKSGGNVGIGTMEPAYQLQLSTDSAAKPSTNTWTIASDARIKTETGEYTKGLDAVLSLRPVTYRYNGKAGMVDDGEDKISIIAQEAINAFPECVGSYMTKLDEDDEEETEVLNWNGHALTFALVNSIKELTARLEALENN